MLYTHCLDGAKLTLQVLGHVEVYTAEAAAAAAAATQCHTHTALMV
jgi:hypothetical protein